MSGIVNTTIKYGTLPSAVSFVFCALVKRTSYVAWIIGSMFALYIMKNHVLKKE